MKIPVGDARRVDHINHDTLDNRRCNLRICNTKQNNANRRRLRPGYKGVEYSPKLSKWRARIRANGKLIQLGCFTFAEDAARAYDCAAAYFFGDFAHLNFPRAGVQ